VNNSDKPNTSKNQVLDSAQNTNEAKVDDEQKAIEGSPSQVVV
jgi:hypothetical protein